MKKIFIISTLLFLLVFSCYATKNVGMLSDNAVLKDYFSRFFDKDEYAIKTIGSNIPKDLLFTQDKRLYEYLLYRADSDTLIIPFVENVSGFVHKTIYVYQNSKIDKVYESLETSNMSFPPEVILNILPYISEKQYGLLKIEEKTPGSSIRIDSKPATIVDDYILLEAGVHEVAVSSLGYNTDSKSIDLQPNKVINIRSILQRPVYHNIEIDSKVASEVYKDGVYIGSTPLVIEEYSIPLVLRLKAEGYSDRVVSVNEPSDRFVVNMKSISMSDAETFKTTQDQFYKSFMRSLLAFGSLAAVKGSNILNPNQANIARYVIDGGIFASVAGMGFDLYRYFKNTKDIAP